MFIYNHTYNLTAFHFGFTQFVGPVVGLCVCCIWISWMFYYVYFRPACTGVYMYAHFVYTIFFYCDWWVAYCCFRMCERVYLIVVCSILRFKVFIAQNKDYARFQYNPFLRIKVINGLLVILFKCFFIADVRC